MRWICTYQRGEARQTEKVCSGKRVCGLARGVGVVTEVSCCCGSVVVVRYYCIV